MEFNYRTFGEPASPYSFLTEQAFRAGYLGPPGNDFLKQRELREAILIELEKERIRQEVIATEIARKRSVEDELRRGRNGGIERSIGFANHSHESLAEERVGMSLEKRLGNRAATRQEVIATEIARKRSVEDELRRGRIGGIERSIGFVNHSHESLAEERVGMSLEKRLGNRAATRQEVIATEIARKRSVEDELRRGRNGGIERSIGFVNHSHESLAEERVGMSLEKRLGMRAATRQETAPFHSRYY